MQTLQSLRETPLPAVFRLAAESVQSGKWDYSCDAITDAVYEELGDILTKDQVDEVNKEYQAQYAQAFGPEVPHDWFAGATGHHPFWNVQLKLSPEPGLVVQARVNALLFMAAICENPIQ